MSLAVRTDPNRKYSQKRTVCRLTRTERGRAAAHPTRAVALFSFEAHASCSHCADISANYAF